MNRMPCYHRSTMGAGLVVALLSIAAAVADPVDDILASNLLWRAAHPVSKCRLLQIGGDGAVVGLYYLDLRSSRTNNPTEVTVMSTRLPKSEFVSRMVREASYARIFFNEDVYVELTTTNYQSLTPNKFWSAQSVPEARAALTEVYDISGTKTNVLDGVSYPGIDLTVNSANWDIYKTTIGTNVIASVPAALPAALTVFFGPSGDLRFIETRTPKVNVEMVFYDWTDLSAKVAELDDMRIAPHARQERWDVPVDEALFRYLARLGE